MRWGFFSLWLFFLASDLAASEQPMPLTLFSKNDISIPSVPFRDDDSLWLICELKIHISVNGSKSPPLSMSTITGSYQGMNADYLDLMKNNLGVALSVKNYCIQENSINALKKFYVDLYLTSPDASAQTRQDMISSPPLTREYPILVSQQTDVMKYLHSNNEKLTIAVNLHFPSKEFIKKSFLLSKVVSYQEDYQDLASVTAKKNDYFKGSNLTSIYLTPRGFYKNLEVMKFWTSPHNSNVFLGIKNNLKLIKIVDSFIDSLSEPVHNQITWAWKKRGSLSFLTQPLALKTQGKYLLEKTTTLCMLIEPYYVPFSMFDRCIEIRGIVGDIINLIHLKIGLNFQPVVDNSNSEIVEIMNRGEWNIVPTTYSPERVGEISFSHFYISMPFVVVVQANNNPDLSSNSRMKVDLPAYHTLSSKLKSSYPRGEWISAENTSTGLSLLDCSKVDTVITMQLASYYILEHYYPGKITFTQIADESPAKTSFSFPHREPEPQSIIDKTQDYILTKEILDMSGKWISMAHVKIEAWPLYSRVFYCVVGLTTLLVFICLMWSGYLLKAVCRRKTSQAALEYQIKIHQTLFNAIPVPVYVMTAEGDLDSFNHEFDSFFDARLRPDMRLSIFDHRHPLTEIFPKIQQEIQQGLTADMAIRHQMVLHNGEEDRLILHWMKLCHLPSTTPPKIICGWQDITESRQLMQELKAEKDKAIYASQAKSIFLASMSHEIRTPVSAIIGFLELVSTGNQSAKENEESIKLAYSTAQSLIGLIGDVLDMEKIESGKYELKPEWVDPEALIRSTVRNFEGLAIQKKIELTGLYSFTKCGALWLAPQTIKQVLANVIGNAIKFTTEGGVQVFAEMQRLEDDKAQLTLRIQDSGVGISEQEQQLLFRPFSQASNGRQQTGSGLGLVISRKLVECSGGEMNMTSQEGGGTIVTIVLPTRVSDNVTLASDLSDCIDEGPKNLNILIVDDHPTNRLLLRSQLTMLGYTVDEAKDGVTAFNLLKRNHYGLMITDLNMPVMDGISLTKWIRQTNQNIIIWGLTANALTDEKERCLNSGMNLCLFKPVHLKQLQKALCDIKLPTVGNTLSQFIDMDKLRDLTLNDKALMIKMLEQSYLENTKDIAQTRSAFDKKNLDLAWDHVHRINGGAQIVGAKVICIVAEKIESMLIAGEYTDDLRNQIDTLEEYINAFSSAIDNFLSSEWPLLNKSNFAELKDQITHSPTTQTVPWQSRNSVSSTDTPITKR